MRAVLVAVLLSLSVGSRRARKVEENSTNSCGSKGRMADDDEDESGIQIVNGRPASECDWKWQVSLQDRVGHFCGGMLISRDWLLSAAHCMGGSFKVVAGEHNLRRKSGNEQTRNAVRQVSHPKYNKRNNDFDISLVKVDSRFNLNRCVGTVCLPSRGNDVRPGTSCWITGWGTLKAGGSSPDILQEGKVNTISNNDCANKFDYSSNQIKASMLCAQGRTSSGQIVDACQGDSGGPLVCSRSGTWTIYGATSWGRGCAGRRYPGVWARVEPNLRWISDTMR